jgi:hypothetical protein
MMGTTTKPNGEWSDKYLQYDRAWPLLIGGGIKFEIFDNFKIYQDGMLITAKNPSPTNKVYVIRDELTGLVTVMFNTGFDNNTAGDTEILSLRPIFYLQDSVGPYKLTIFNYDYARLFVSSIIAEYTLTNTEELFFYKTESDYTSGNKTSILGGYSDVDNDAKFTKILNIPPKNPNNGGISVYLSSVAFDSATEEYLDTNIELSPYYSHTDENGKIHVYLTDNLVFNVKEKYPAIKPTEFSAYSIFPTRLSMGESSA